MNKKLCGSSQRHARIFGDALYRVEDGAEGRPVARRLLPAPHHELPEALRPLAGVGERGAGQQVGDDTHDHLRGRDVVKRQLASHELEEEHAVGVGVRLLVARLPLEHLRRRPAGRAMARGVDSRAKLEVRQAEVAHLGDAVLVE